MAALAFRDPARLQPRISFAEARGLLPMPVSGRILRGFGAGDGPNAARGLTIATQPRAIVSAPADAWVAYAGPYRSFGQLLILNAGGGYYLVLSGLKRIDVTLGQFVLAGEPVGAMGDTAEAAMLIGQAANGEDMQRAGADGPALYVEFRKDGSPIDPGPWWAKQEDRKVRG